MYEITLVLHSLLRWLVLVCAAVALFQAYSGWFGKKSWSDSDRRWNVMFAHSMTLQFIIGLLLYAVLSPEQKKLFDAEHSRRGGHQGGKHK